MFGMSPDLAINSLRTYALSHEGKIIKPRLGKEYDSVMLDTKKSSRPSPKIHLENGVYTIYCENQQFEPSEDEVTSLFTFVLFHYVFNLQMDKKVAKKLNALIKNYFVN